MPLGRSDGAALGWWGWMEAAVKSRPGWTWMGDSRGCGEFLGRLGDCGGGRGAAEEGAKAARGGRQGSQPGEGGAEASQGGGGLLRPSWRGGL